MYLFVEIILAIVKFNVLFIVNIHVVVYNLQYVASNWYVCIDLDVEMTVQIKSFETREIKGSCLIWQG